MCDLGISPENFNPRIFYVLKRKFNDESITPYHSHDFISLIYILSGSCFYNINGSLYRVKKGDVIVCNPGVLHGKMLSPGEEIVEFHVGFNDISIKHLPKDCIIDENASPIITLSKHEQDFFKCCNEILLEQEKNEPGCDLLLKALVMKLIVILLKATRVSENLPEGGILHFESYDRINIVNTIISFINDNYMKNISLEKISRNMYLSPAYISKIFKEETGESPINYLIKIRLSKARELLENSSFSIKEIAKSVGYHDVFHFSKLFKKYYGHPPSKHKSPDT